MSQLDHHKLRIIMLSSNSLHLRIDQIIKKAQLQHNKK